jgi:hypothetical protein
MHSNITAHSVEMLKVGHFDLLLSQLYKNRYEENYTPDKYSLQVNNEMQSSPACSQ